jgi:hypothetical protein
MRYSTMYRRASTAVRLLILLALAAAGGIVGAASPAAAATLTGPTWTVSKSTTGATTVSYTYTFTVATTSSLSSVTMSVPSGTAGTPTVGSVSGLASGTISLVGSTLTYSFTSASVASGTAVSIKINGLTNTSTAGTYASTITTLNGASSVDTGTTGSVVLTTGALSNLGLSVSPSTISTAASYTFTFTVPATVLSLVTSITMTVPPGTSGTPTVGTISPSSVLLSPTVSISGTTLTLSFVSVALASATTFSVQINGLTNTATAGSYTSEIVTYVTGIATYSGITPAVSITGTLTLASPSSLSWSATLNGTNQAVADSNSSDQQFSVSDQSGSGAGWHITVSGTTFTNGTQTLPNSGTFVFTGSLSSITATTAPTAACSTSCTPPLNTTSYPVAITTAASSPTPATVYDVSANSGIGPMTLGGHTAANPVGWWTKVPANVRAGSYTSTVTVAVVSGP